MATTEETIKHLKKTMPVFSTPHLAEVLKNLIERGDSNEHALTVLEEIKKRILKKQIDKTIMSLKSSFEEINQNRRGY